MASFVTECDEDLVAYAGRRVRQLECAVFFRFAELADLLQDDDIKLERRRIAASFGRAPSWAEDGILGYYCLRDFPLLRALQEETYRLDVARLAAIHRATSCLHELDEPAAFAAVDEMLVELFTPSKLSQALPAPRTIKEKITTCVRQFDPELAPNLKRKQEREEEAAKPGGETPLRLDCSRLGQSDSQMTLSGSELHLGLILKNVEAVAKERGITEAEAAALLLLGEVQANAKITLNVFAPKLNPGSYYVENFGWTNAESTKIIDEFLAENPHLVRDLDAAAGAATPAYSPTDTIKAYVRARDGHCIYPGCTKPAEKCQLDHRIPFGDGGKTTPNNLFCLCAQHHNMKTDRLAFYMPDPETGDIVWLFADGTFETVTPDGVLAGYTTPTKPRWTATIEQRHKQIARRQAFNNRCHSVLDSYEQDNDYDACATRLSELERQYGLQFEHWPDPPKPENVRPRLPAGWSRFCAKAFPGAPLELIPIHPDDPPF